jgi:hypothetical protein
VVSSPKKCSWSCLLGLHSRHAVMIVATAIMGLFCTAAANASLPDGRAWEMVSPLGKNGGDIRGINGDNGGGVVQAAPNGNRLTYVSLASFGDTKGAPVGSQYVSGRNVGEGWLTWNISTALNSQTYPLGGAGTPYDAFSMDLTGGLLLNGTGGYQVEHPVESPPLVESAPAGYQNYYLTSFAEGGLEEGITRPLLTSVPTQPASIFNLNLVGETKDLSHIVVTSRAALAPGAVEEEGKSNLYEWSNGRFETLNIRSDGTPDSTREPFLGSDGGQEHTVSDDGSRVIWTGSPSPPAEGRALYVREGIGTSQPTTIQVDASQGGADSGGYGEFLTANADDSRIFFADTEKLTGDSTAADQGSLGDLYEFDVNSGRLSDLTIDHTDEKGARVQGILGASEDGSYVYFVANGVLAAGASPGTCRLAGAPANAICNLYVWHNGTIKFIATLSTKDQNTGFNYIGVAFDWDSKIRLRTARVTPDGTHVVFMSLQSLTNYNNEIRGGGSCGASAINEPLPALCEEVYTYDADTARLECVSCNPTGVRPAGPSGIPGGTDFETGKAFYQSRVLSDNGDRVFFDSVDSLSDQDVNDKEDVYEFEDGRIYLLSGGRGAGRSSFVDASTDGDDAFFITRDELVGEDTDQLVDVYDARAPHAAGEAVGFQPPSLPESCNGEDCRSATALAPAFQQPSSATFVGSGNAIAAPVLSKSTTQRRKKKSKPRRRAAHRRTRSTAKKKDGLR